MPGIMRVGGAGTPFNFTVTAYAAAGDIPASGKANDIAVITSVAIPKINSGGIISKPGRIAPTTRSNGDALQSGDLWLVTGLASNFEFVVVNGISVYYQFCFQFTGSAWTPRAAKIYYNNTWVDWGLYLYKAGNECLSVSGGWQATARTIKDFYPALAPGLTKGAAYMTATQDSGGYIGCGVVEVATDMDLTNASTLVFDLEISSAQYWALYVASRNDANYYYSCVASYSSSGALSRALRAINVAAINGSYNVCAALMGAAAGFKIHDVYCE